MMNIVKVVMLFLFFFLFLKLPAEAQRRGQGGLRRTEIMLTIRLPVEQILGFLAFDHTVELTNDKLLEIREVLRGIYVKRSKLLKEMEKGDRQEVMEKTGELRTLMTKNLSLTLNPEQVVKLKKFMQKRQRRGQGGRRPGRNHGQRGSSGTES